MGFLRRRSPNPPVGISAKYTRGSNWSEVIVGALRETESKLLIKRSERSCGGAWFLNLVRF